MRHSSGISGTAMLALGFLLLVLGVATDGPLVASIGVVVLLVGLYTRSANA